MTKAKSLIYTSHYIKKRARRDGRGWRWRFFPFAKTVIEVDPPQEQKEPAMFEQELLKVTDQNITRIKNKWAEIDEELSKNCDDAVDKYLQAKTQIDDISEGHQEVVDAYIKAKETYYNQPMPHISRGIYWLVFTIITVGEIAFNALVFNVLGQSQLHTIVMAVALMVAIPYLSHFIGSALRAEGIQHAKKTVVMIVLSAMVVLAGLIVIALLREKFFEANAIAERLGIRWDANSIALTFLIVNIVLFVAIVVLAYEAGHKNPTKFKKAKRAFYEASGKLQEEAGDMEEAAKRLVEAKERLNKVHSEREHAFEAIKTEAQEVIDIILWNINLYRAENMRVRAGKKMPLSFLNKHELELPVELRELEDCQKECRCYEMLTEKKA